MDLNKPVFILAQGPSIKTLEDRIEEFADFDVIWASFNKFALVEPIVEKIGKHLNIVYGINSLRMLEEQESIRKFLSLGGDRKFILTPSQLINSRTHAHIYHELDFLFEKQNTEIIHSHLTRDNGSMIHMIPNLISLGYKKFILFGVDGQLKKTLVSNHYKQDEYNNGLEKRCNSGGSLVDDTRKLNEGFEQYTKDIDMTGVEIFNCNPDSLVTAFPIINYDQVKETYESLSVQ